MNTVEVALTKIKTKLHLSYFFSQGLKGDPGPGGHPGLKGDKVSPLASRTILSLHPYS